MTDGWSRGGHQNQTASHLATVHHSGHGSDLDLTAEYSSVNMFITKGDIKVQFFGLPIYRGVSVTQPPMDHLTQNFACEDLLGGTFDFCSSQGHMTSTEAKPVLASKCDWPLYRSHNLDLTKTQ